MHLLFGDRSPIINPVDVNTITSIGTALSAVAAVAAIIVSVIVYRGQFKLTERVTAEQSAVSLTTLEPAAAFVAAVGLHEQPEKHRSSPANRAGCAEGRQLIGTRVALLRRWNGRRGRD